MKGWQIWQWYLLKMKLLEHLMWLSWQKHLHFWKLGKRHFPSLKHSKCYKVCLLYTLCWCCRKFFCKNLLNNSMFLFTYIPCVESSVLYIWGPTSRLGGGWLQPPSACPDRLRTSRANVHYGKDFTVNVAIHVWELKFICNLVGI